MTMYLLLIRSLYPMLVCFVPPYLLTKQSLLLQFQYRCWCWLKYRGYVEQFPQSCLMLFVNPWLQSTICYSSYPYAIVGLCWLKSLSDRLWNPNNWMTPWSSHDIAVVVGGFSHCRHTKRQLQLQQLQLQVGSRQVFSIFESFKSLS